MSRRFLCLFCFVLTAGCGADPVSNSGSSGTADAAADDVLQPETVEPDDVADAGGTTGGDTESDDVGGTTSGTATGGDTDAGVGDSGGGDSGSGDTATGAEDVVEPTDLVAEDGSGSGTGDPVDAATPDAGCGGASGCDVDEVCLNGLCIDACSLEASAKTGHACRHFAVDLPNTGSGGEVSAADAPFGVALLNPSQTQAVTVSVHEIPGGPVFDNLVFDIPPGGWQVVPLGARNVAGTLKAQLAWVLDADRPFAAWQMNPLNIGNSTHSNDASRLIPPTPKSHEFIAVTGRHNGFVTVVGTMAGTQVSVRPAGNIAAGGGVVAMEAGKLYTLDLSPGEVLNLSADGIDVDLTGTEILASLPVIAYSGNVLTRTNDACCSDHIEQALPPVSAWGTEIVGTRATPRGGAPDYWRVVASEDDTQVSFSPTVHAPVTLNRGQWIEFEAAANFVATASEPVLLAQLMASGHEGTLQGRFCYSDAECPQSQQCVVVTAGKAGRCYAKCAVQKDDCPSSVFTCHDRWGELEGFGKGEGLCHRNTCAADDSPCPLGAVCVAGQTASICYEPCNVGQACEEPGAGCGLLESQTVCAAATCLVEEAGAACVDGQGETIDGTTCAVVPTSVGEDAGQCQFGCEPSAVCAVPGYKCLSSKLYPTGTKPFGGDVCVPPVCESHADCPDGHLCGGTEAPLTCRPVGDPALAIAVPVEQWTDRMMLAVPSGYAFDYINVTTPVGASVQLDGMPLQPNDFVPIGTGYRVITLAITDGLHLLTATHPMGVTVYGFDDEAAYSTAAGGALVALSETGPVVDPDADVEVVDTEDTADADDPDAAEVVEAGVPTWNENIAPLLALKCAPCHTNGNDSGNANFDAFANIQGLSASCGQEFLLAEAIVLKVKEPNPCDGTIMPPVGDPLKPSEIKLLEDWLSGGIQEL